MHNDIISYISQFVELSSTETNELLSICQTKTIAKGEYYISEGQIPKRFAFVRKGLFRYLYINDKGHEFTKNFMPEGNFIASYSAMITATPSKMYIQALENCEIHEIDYSKWTAIRVQNKIWDSFLVMLLERAFMIKETRERELLLLDAAERYSVFKKEFPDLEKRVKQHQIASYLGISPISLSRLKK